MKLKKLHKEDERRPAKLKNTKQARADQEAASARRAARKSL